MNRKLISLLLVLILSVSLAMGVCAAETHLYDEADLLADWEEVQLAEKLANISAQYNAQIIIATVNSTGQVDTDTYLEYFYDSNHFGYGPNRDGVLLLISMEYREYRILSNGYAGVAIDPYTIELIGDAIVNDLSYGDYAAAFDEFADQCAYYLDGYMNGYPFDAGQNFLICLVIGLVIGLITVFALKGQLKSVRKQNQANSYIKSGSMNLTACHDIFLYRNVSRSRKANNNSSGSRSGSSRSTGGGRF